MRRRKMFTGAGKQYLAPEAEDGRMWSNIRNNRITPQEQQRTCERSMMFSMAPRWRNDPTYNHPFKSKD